jgi:hypothetical protein
MDSNATADTNIRALPIYRLGWSEGHDLGLRQGLDAVAAERTRLDALADVHASSTHSPAHLAYADGRLAAVALVIAGIFRQATR